MAAIIVGAKAARNKLIASSEESGNFELSIEKPAGLGAFAKIVSPPPTNAPETSAHLDKSLKFGTCEPK